MPKGISERLHQQRKAIAKRIEDGLEPNEVAREFGCSISYVHRCGEIFGLNVGYVQKEDVIKIIAAFLDKPTATIEEIAKQTGILEARVRWIKQAAAKEGLQLGRGRGRPKSKQ